jgi:hypothetical protein
LKFEIKYFVKRLERLLFSNKKSDGRQLRKKTQNNPDSASSVVGEHGGFCLDPFGSIVGFRCRVLGCFIEMGFTRRSIEKVLSELMMIETTKPMPSKRINMAEQHKLGIFLRQFIVASVALFCYLTLGLMWPIQEPLEPGFDGISRFGDVDIAKIGGGFGDGCSLWFSFRLY